MASPPSFCDPPPPPQATFDDQEQAVAARPSVLVRGEQDQEDRGVDDRHPDVGRNLTWLRTAKPFSRRPDEEAPDSASQTSSSATARRTGSRAGIVSGTA